MRDDITEADEEAAIRFLARLVPIGGEWPTFAWVYITAPSNRWFRVHEPYYGRTRYRREDDEISEYEANALGIFRKRD
jgi:hypothetical protein